MGTARPSFGLRQLFEQLAPPPPPFPKFLSLPSCSQRLPRCEGGGGGISPLSATPKKEEKWHQAFLPPPPCLRGEIRLGYSDHGDLSSLPPPFRLETGRGGGMVACCTQKMVGGVLQLHLMLRHRLTPKKTLLHFPKNERFPFLSGAKKIDDNPCRCACLPFSRARK